VWFLINVSKAKVNGVFVEGKSSAADYYTFGTLVSISITTEFIEPTQNKQQCTCSL